MNHDKNSNSSINNNSNTKLINLYKKKNCSIIRNNKKGLPASIYIHKLGWVDHPQTVGWVDFFTVITK